MNEQKRFVGDVRSGKRRESIVAFRRCALRFVSSSRVVHTGTRDLGIVVFDSHTSNSSIQLCRKPPPANVATYNDFHHVFSYFLPTVTVGSLLCTTDLLLFATNLFLSGPCPIHPSHFNPPPFWLGSVSGARTHLAQCKRVTNMSKGPAQGGQAS